MRRLYSTFARGWPGVGLLLLRLVVGVALVSRSPSLPPMALVFPAVCGILIVAGLWTPLAGTMIALLETWQILTQPGDRWVALLLGSMSIALALLGPGWWSADAHLFGWKRIESVGGKNVSKFR